METWKKIEGFESYSVSSHGNVRSCFFNNLLHSGDNGRGYRFVHLYHHGKSKRFYVHRLVASAFIPNPENKPQVNHVDCNKANNHVKNLEWVTLFEQMQHASKTGRLYCSEYQKKQTAIANSGTRSHLSKLTDFDVKEIRRIKTETGLPNHAIAGLFNVNRETVGHIVRGKTWKHLI